MTLQRVTRGKREMQSHAVLPEKFREKKIETKETILPINVKNKNECNFRRIEYKFTDVL